MTGKNVFKSIGILLAIVLVFGAAAAALNIYTGPIIEKNNASAKFAPFLEVMPDAVDFEVLYDFGAKGDTQLIEVPETVKYVCSEVSGLGYVIVNTASDQYSKEPMEITIGFTPEGKISGIRLANYTDSKELPKDYPESYIGQNSTLSDVNLIAGTTYSSIAFRDAVSEAFEVLISNALIKEGVKSPAQLLKELLPSIHSGMADAQGNLKLTDDSTDTVLISRNGAGAAYIYDDCMVVFNNTGGAKVYDTEGNDVTADKQELVHRAFESFSAVSFEQFSIAKFNRMLELDDAEPTVLTLNDCFNSVTDAYKYEADGSVYYAFHARPFGFDIMDIYIIVNESGAIVKIAVKELIFEKEYFAAFGGVNEGKYYEGFTGQTIETWNEDAAIIATATMTSNAMKTAVNDIFAAFQSICGGVNR
ncbi:MAG: FMN-binding protein [Christensenellales bacterium]